MLLGRKAETCVQEDLISDVGALCCFLNSHTTPTAVSLQKMRLSMDTTNPTAHSKWASVPLIPYRGDVSLKVVERGLFHLGKYGTSTSFCSISGSSWGVHDGTISLRDTEMHQAVVLEHTCQDALIQDVTFDGAMATAVTSLARLCLRRKKSLFRSASSG